MSAPLKYVFSNECRPSMNAPPHTKNNLIHCLKEGQSCHSGAEIFQEQLAILSEPDTNPFDRLVAEDIDEATPESSLIDIDDEDEIEIF